MARLCRKGGGRRLQNGCRSIKRGRGIRVGAYRKSCEFSPQSETIPASPKPVFARLQSLLDRQDERPLEGHPNTAPTVAVYCVATRVRPAFTPWLNCAALLPETEPAP